MKMMSLLCSTIIVRVISNHMFSKVQTKEKRGFQSAPIFQKEVLFIVSNKTMLIQIDWSHFTPTSALIGGLLIGLTAVLLMASLGRIAGVTGIVAEGLKRPFAASSWRYAFILGLVFAAPIYAIFMPRT